MTKAKPTKVKKPPATLKLVVTDRVAIPGGAACPRCAALMQRYRRRGREVPRPPRGCAIPA
jgi:hypothetical protein